MGYIKTKDGNIFKLYSKTDKKGSFKVYHSLNWLGYGYVSYKKVIKQADTIEELCDEFVCDFGENKTKLHAYNLSIAKKTKATNIYGAIWTYDSNGVPTLKPVAKTNEEGVLCLI